VLGVPVPATTSTASTRCFLLCNAERRTRRYAGHRKTGAANAALLAAEILAATDEALYQRLAAWRATRTQDVLERPSIRSCPVEWRPQFFARSESLHRPPGGLLAILGGGQLGP